MRVDFFITFGLGILGALASNLRWWRVAQREHYLSGAALRFARRWWFGTRLNTGIAVVGIAGAIVGLAKPEAAIVPVLAFALGPPGLTIRGWTGRLAWTRRATTVAVVTVVIEGIWVALGARSAGLFGATAAIGAVAAAVPLLVDTALQLLSPIENRLARRYVRRASAVLERVTPTVVGITGSYGKTSTKVFLAHLASERLSVVASPRSYNNRAGLARAVNEQLVTGTDVFIAEMGTYGQGEIKEMCSWLHPSISVMTAIGPVHLERFGTLETTLRSKAEIAEDAATVVVNADDERLSVLADELAEKDKVVVRCSALDESADVAVLERDGELVLYLKGRRVGVLRPVETARPLAATNVACAIGAALALGCDEDEIVRRAGDLPEVENRLEARESTSGAAVLDDTFNSNPAGARLALQSLAATPAGRRVVVTPGIVELGSLQGPENEAFAAAAAEVATDFVVVGRTNRAALLRGARGAAKGDELRVREARRLADAVEWARDEFGPGDVILYENDLPDHYP